MASPAKKVKTAEGNRGTVFERGTKPDTGGSYDGFDHIHFWVANAKQAADWYQTRFGFSAFAYRGLETGSRDVSSHAIRMGRVVFVFSNALNPSDETATTIGSFLSKHGDFVRDVAFRVDNCRAIYETAVKRGAVSVQAPIEDKDEHGVVVRAAVQTYGDCIHSFIERRNYRGLFLPGFVADTTGAGSAAIDPVIEDRLGKVAFDFVDHVVGNQPDNEMLPVAEWYEKVLQFHRFWSVDDKMIHTEYSSLRSIVVADYDETVKMPINEPAAGKKKSQIQEYVDYHGGPGVQHIALNTRCILETVAALRKRGLRFLSVPHAYYVNLKERLAVSKVHVTEDIDELEKLGILVDFDDHGYLLQLFTKPVQDRPTLFFEFIQRENHGGFGAGNFKALFESIERDQAERGNL